MDSSKWLSVKQVAVALGLAEVTIRKWKDQGKIACHKFGGRIRISSEELNRFVADCERPRTFGLEDCTN